VARITADRVSGHHANCVIAPRDTPAASRCGGREASNRARRSHAGRQHPGHFRPHWRRAGGRAPEL